MRPTPVEHIERLWRLYHTPAGRKMIRYALVSVVSTAVSFAVLGIVYGAVRLWSEVPSTVFANVVATVPSYYLNRNWVWGKRGRSHLLKEVMPFWAASIAGIVLSVFTSSEARHLGQTYFLNDHGIRTGLVEAANLFAFGLLWILKFLLFNKLFHHHHHHVAEEPEEEPVALAVTSVGVIPEN